MGNVEGRLKALRSLRESGGIAKFPAVVRASSYASGRCLTGFWPLQTALCSVVASIGSNVVGNIGSDVVSQMTAGFWLPSPPTTLGADNITANVRSEEHTSELQSRLHLVCRLLLEKKKRN